jgi:hypothetical protein
MAAFVKTGCQNVTRFQRKEELVVCESTMILAAPLWSFTVTYVLVSSSAICKLPLFFSNSSLLVS